jgi:hypothetical protein
VAGEDGGRRVAPVVDFLSFFSDQRRRSQLGRVLLEALGRGEAAGDPDGLEHRGLGLLRLLVVVVVSGRCSNGAARERRQRARARRGGGGGGRESRRRSRAAGGRAEGGRGHGGGAGGGGAGARGEGLCGGALRTKFEGVEVRENQAANKVREVVAREKKQSERAVAARLLNRIVIVALVIVARLISFRSREPSFASHSSHKIDRFRSMVKER